MKQAVFLDRDGVINDAIIRNGKPYAPTTWEEFKIFPEVPGALQTLAQAGFLLIVATNQPDVGRGLIRRMLVDDMHRQLMETFPLDDIRVCYDTEESGSPYYKPRPGMLLEAAKEFGVDLSKSYMVGDRWRDVGCGLAAGCFTIWIDRGYTEPVRYEPHATCGNLQEAVSIILEHSRV
ncbi:MAG: HAD-IIIA family hydrolase [Nitrospira sp.]|nr:HAD-IIIA family hydrolase [Nitrospira sp.]MCB9710595.1 HAD-IIIA family hydrolase [Nitrospiraceae bacterium]MDR4486934.1 HAD-IIIA family hydrolase [Nitrospirales bacterium]MCA9466141.1 HAD-IIIA family hydrolase [Nitrospira sp.]MCA9475955.1 HAD-IIIA family hydrolase [Nitrospira sp.]